MEVLFEPKCAICPAEPDDLASGGCSDGCELLTGEVCEASWWDGLLNGSESEGPEAGFNGSQHELSAMEWQTIGGLEADCDPNNIPCMADELEHFSEQLPFLQPCEPEILPSPVLQNCLSSSNVSALSCATKASVPAVFAAQPPAMVEAAEEEAAEADAAAAASASPTCRGVLMAVALNQREPKGEEEEGGPLSPALRALRMKLPDSLKNAEAIRDGCSPPFAGAWRGCAKSSWCNRENRHRGVCNTRAEVPGLAAYGAEQLAAEGVRGADFPGQWQLPGTFIKEEQPRRDDLDDSEQASATEVLLERACDPDAQCLDSGIPRCCQVSIEPQPNCHSRTRLRLMVKRQQQAPAEEGSPPDGPPTPELQAPAFASQESSDSANTQRETDASSEDTGGADADEVRCCAHIDRSPPPKATLAAAKTSERLRRVSPSTPEATAHRPSSKPTPERLERSLQVSAAAGRREAVVSPFAASLPLSHATGRGSSPGGFVQTSSGRIARPTPKTAASRAASDDLSELSHTEGHRAPTKRKSGRPAKGGEKSKRRRMVGGILKTVGHAAPGQQCTQCGTQVTPVWRAGPYGPKTLCNACGVRYMKQVKKK
ncbi:hypothetical protein COCSUDRAFT_48229 [Coccomyxa subellipsoidea C-169]|uniref:GATA-type domain-containing protein n=1 Tax=Coccomyxa subellipsoidea (strain C-169) TaxID=574566 RepID=I0YRH4_COCSC|nr:hypothetical protein COCSUDRAFT_48229 [Coccomyxa subellipsoidea C-169]EIE20993.1 hypothetical protein COCSUDRAFT_48229 [Coccomyxa subellipsoidea C-169]|eukprot:XP_005645537.1 hypothetical protein COCSUDRAFT_48229 [Coccomyxa subellipsoidea C-169]